MHLVAVGVLSRRKVLWLVKAEGRSSGGSVLVKRRDVSVSRNSGSVTRSQSSIVVHSGVDTDSVVPKSRRVGRPLESDLDIERGLVEVEEVLEDRLALSRVETDNAEGVPSVDEERLPASDLQGYAGQENMERSVSSWPS